MKDLIALVAICGAVALSASLHAQTAEALPEDVSSIATNLKSFGRVFERLEATPSDDPATLDWLRRHARSLPPPMLYQYAYKLQENGQTDAALVELARARLGRDMDAAECLKRDEHVQFMMEATDLIEMQLHYKVAAAAGRADLKRWLRAIGIVLADASSRQMASALWICGEGNFNASDLAAKGRQEQFDFLHQNYEQHLVEEAQAPDR